MRKFNNMVISLSFIVSFYLVTLCGCLMVPTPVSGPVGTWLEFTQPLPDAVSGNCVSRLDTYVKDEPRDSQDYCSVFPTFSYYVDPERYCAGDVIDFELWVTAGELMFECYFQYSALGLLPVRSIFIVTDEEPSEETVDVVMDLM